MKKDEHHLYGTSEKQLKKFNWADYRLYNYFKQKLEKESKLKNKLIIIFGLRLIKK